MSAEDVNLDEIEGHHNGRSRVLLLHAEEHLIESPRLTRLSFHLRVLEGALNEAASRATYYSGEKRAPLEAQHARDRLAE